MNSLREKMFAAKKMNQALGAAVAFRNVGNKLLGKKEKVTRLSLIIENLNQKPKGGKKTRKNKRKTKKSKKSKRKSRKTRRK